MSGWLALSSIVADGRTGANRNLPVRVMLETPNIVADGRTGANRNQSGQVCETVTIVADGRTGANRNTSPCSSRVSSL